MNKNSKNVFCIKYLVIIKKDKLVIIKIAVCFNCSITYKEEISMNVKKMNHPNESIRCQVNTCHYYMAGDYCTAEKIEVKPRNASSSEETDCVTFTSDTNA